MTAPDPYPALPAALAWDTLTLALDRGMGETAGLLARSLAAWLRTPGADPWDLVPAEVRGGRRRQRLMRTRVAGIEAAARNERGAT